MVKRYQQIRCQESGHDRDSLLPATLLPQEPRLLAFQARNWQCQPALLLHCYGNRPAALMTLQVFLAIWWIRGHYQRETRHKQFTMLFPRFLNGISVKVLAALSQKVRMDLHCIHAVHCISCIRCDCKANFPSKISVTKQATTWTQVQGRVSAQASCETFPSITPFWIHVSWSCSCWAKRPGYMLLVIPNHVKLLWIRHLWCAQKCQGNIAFYIVKTSTHLQNTSFSQVHYRPCPMQSTNSWLATDWISL